MAVDDSVPAPDRPDPRAAERVARLLEGGGPGEVTAGAQEPAPAALASTVSPAAETADLGPPGEAGPPTAPAGAGAPAATTLVPQAVQPAPAAAAAAATAGAAVPAEAPHMLGRYRILQRLGGGGMGVVYRALDTHLKRDVALKVLKADLTGDEYRRRFLHEVAAMARLQHPNLLPVHDSGEADRQLYYTMDLVHGESLDHVIRRMKALPPRAALRIVRDAALGIQHAHEKGILHRDLKPANILVSQVDRTEEGEAGRERDSRIDLSSGITARYRAVVMDFGLARDAAASRMTQTGAVMGTLLYMSPEQAEGRGDLGAAADVYSLGATLYEAIAGVSPFDADNQMHLLFKILREEPAPLGRIMPTLHPDVATICEKAMAKAAARRYPTARALAEDIDRYLRGEVIEARPASRAYRLWRKAVRYRNVVLPVAAALLVAATAVAWPFARAAWSARRARLERTGREAASRDLLAQAGQARRDGALDRAEEMARRLIATYEHACAELAEDHPVPEAYALLGEVLAARGQAHDALLARYRAYSAATRHASGRPFLVGLARQLVEEARFEEARGMLRPLVGPPVANAADAEARYWLARACEGAMELERAAVLFGAAAAGPLPQDLRRPCDEHRRFCERFAGEVVLSQIPGDAFVAADLDGDGRPELIVGSGAGILAGNVSDDGTWTLRARHDFGPAAQINMVQLAAADLDGDGRAEIVATPRGDGGGLLMVLKLDGDRLMPLAQVSERAWLESGPLVGHDLDGDGDPEIVVGGVNGAQQIAVYTWRRARSALELRARLTFEQYVEALVAAPAATKDGPQLLGFFGPWRDYGIRPIRWDGDRLAPGEAIPFGTARSVAELARGPGLELALGNFWGHSNVGPLARRLGEGALRSRCRPPGAYVLRFDASLRLVEEPLCLAGGSWSSGESGIYRVVPVRAEGTTYLWSWGGMTGRPDWEREKAEATRGIWVWARSDGATRPLARLRATDEATTLFTALDLDGDGNDELLRLPPVTNRDLRPAAIRGLKQVRERALAQAAAAEAEACARSGEQTGQARPVAHGREAEMLGLWGEAARQHRDARDRPAGGPGATVSDEERFQAQVGYLRCQAVLAGQAIAAAEGERRYDEIAAEGERQYDEVAVELERAAARWPDRIRELVAPCNEVLVRDRRWDTAARVARVLAGAQGLSPDERGRARHEQEELAALHSLEYRIPLFVPGAVDQDWVVSSPLCVALDGDRIRFWSPYSTPQFCLLPMTLSRSGYELRGAVEIERLEWSATPRLVVASGAGPRPWESSTWGVHDPGEAVTFGYGGATDFPLFDLGVHQERPGGNAEVHLLTAWDDFPRHLDVALGRVPFPDRFVGRVTCDTDATARRERVVTGASPLEGAALVGLARPTQDSFLPFWSILTWRGLELRSAAPGTAVRALEPKRAVEYLVLANGRWVFGRPAEAESFYDRAVALADAEWAEGIRRAEQGLPSPWEGQDASTLDRWAAVDAHLYRGLFRWTRGDRAPGLTDLRQAWELRRKREKGAEETGAGRIAELVAAQALPLCARPAEAEALRELWLEVHGRPAGPALDELVARAWRESGETDEWVEALFGPLGYRVRRTHTVSDVTAGSAAEKAGVRRDDRLVAYGGHELRGWRDLARFRYAAARDQPAPARVVFERAGRRFEVDLPADWLEQGLAVGQAAQVVRER